MGDMAKTSSEKAPKSWFKDKTEFKKIVWPSRNS